ncbi:hypothetical protein QTN47_06515 [Danxiaibacter flavus]|uniref:Alpha/beta hydrolase n=1 Tax=Danxiaibacter flavus TaxID=3049108 RepID=A0ABV3ZFH0_9BACT|nr:hypothetical protein QNM32_06515 [Chitinophagaceae bacterium DXS]
MKFCAVLSSVLLLLAGCNSHQTTPVYKTGLVVFKDFDSTRHFDTSSANSLRPVRIDVFYPSTDSVTHAALSYGDILDMYEQRFNFNTPIDSCKRTSMELAKAFAEYLHVDSGAKMLSYKTGVYRDLKQPVDRLPLIVYAAGMNGSSWDNVILFDSLAKKGFVVACVSSVGKFPGFMTAAVDLDEQVRDILFVIDQMKKLPYIDASKIGLLSWSLGGSAITKAAMLSNEIKCLLSFDGTEIHYYGFDKDWDTQFDEIKTIAPFTPASITVPYMYLGSEHPAKNDSVYSLPAHVNSSEKYFLKFNNGIHENFSSIVSIAKAVDPKIGNIDSNRHEVICDLAATFFNQYLKQDKSVNTRKYIEKLVVSSPSKYDTAWPVYLHK